MDIAIDIVVRHPLLPLEGLVQLIPLRLEQLFLGGKPPRADIVHQLRDQGHKAAAHNQKDTDDPAGKIKAVGAVLAEEVPDQGLYPQANEDQGGQVGHNPQVKAGVHQIHQHRRANGNQGKPQGHGAHAADRFPLRLFFLAKQAFLLLPGLALPAAFLVQALLLLAAFLVPGLPLLPGQLELQLFCLPVGGLLLAVAFLLGLLGLVAGPPCIGLSVFGTAAFPRRGGEHRLFLLRRGLLRGRQGTLFPRGPTGLLCRRGFFLCGLLPLGELPLKQIVCHCLFPPLFLPAVFRTGGSPLPRRQASACPAPARSPGQ